jgi:translation initiation factor 2 subunit 2
MVRIGSKKSGFTNFSVICEQMNRDMDHVYQFFLAELATVGSLTGCFHSSDLYSLSPYSGDNQMVLKGKFTSKHVESLLRKYMQEFVMCGMCRSPRTLLEKVRVLVGQA